jgi:hypothetical protein
MLADLVVSGAGSHKVWAMGEGSYLNWCAAYYNLYRKD